MRLVRCRFNQRFGLFRLGAYGQQNQGPMDSLFSSSPPSHVYVYTYIYIFMYYCRDLGAQNQCSSFLWRTPKLSAIIAPSPSLTGMSNLHAACMPTVASANVFLCFFPRRNWVNYDNYVSCWVFGHSSLNVYVYSWHHHIWPCHFLKLPLWWLQVIFRLYWSTLHPTHLKLQSIPLVFAIKLVEVFWQIFLHFPIWLGTFHSLFSYV